MGEGWFRSVLGVPLPPPHPKITSRAAVGEGQRLGGGSDFGVPFWDVVGGGAGGQGGGYGWVGEGEFFSPKGFLKSSRNEPKNVGAAVLKRRRRPGSAATRSEKRRRHLGKVFEGRANDCETSFCWFLGKTQKGLVRKLNPSGKRLGKEEVATLKEVVATSDERGHLEPTRPGGKEEEKAKGKPKVGRPKR